MTRRRLFAFAWLCPLLTTPRAVGAAGVSSPTAYQRIKTYLDSIPGIDTHDHLRPFDGLKGYVQTERGMGMNLFGLWNSSYYQYINPLTPWKPGEAFSAWWKQAKHDFDNTRATNFYRYMLPAFRDLYGVDFDHITDEQAEDLDRRVYENYRNDQWLHEIVNRRTNIELMFIDTYWNKFDFSTYYKFGVPVFDVSSLLRGFHPSEYKDPLDSPYRVAEARRFPVTSLDDYLALIDRLCGEAKAAGAMSLNDDSSAYVRTLQFDRVPKEAANRVFGRPRTELSPQEVKTFGDFIMWNLAGLSAKYDMPFQIHTGYGRLQGSNPTLLLDLIEGNPKTKFSLFHGGFPWVDETGAIVTCTMPRAANVWIDSNWLPTISYTLAKRAYHEWLEVVPSNRIMWGCDSHHAEGVYAATEMTRRCLAEVLSEKIERGNLTEQEALKIGRQIMRDNALELFPRLKDKLWKSQAQLASPVENLSVSSRHGVQTIEEAVCHAAVGEPPAARGYRL